MLVKEEDGTALLARSFVRRHVHVPTGTVQTVRRTRTCLPALTNARSSPVQLLEHWRPEDSCTIIMHLQKAPSSIGATTTSTWRHTHCCSSIATWPTIKQQNWNKIAPIPPNFHSRITDDSRGNHSSKVSNPNNQLIFQHGSGLAYQLGASQIPEVRQIQNPWLSRLQDGQYSQTLIEQRSLKDITFNKLNC